MLVVAVLDPPIDALELLFKFRMEGGERLFDGCQQGRRADLAQDGILVLPALGTDEIVFEAAKLVALADLDVAGFEGLPQQAIYQKLVAVDIELPVPALGGLGVHVTLNVLRDDASWEVGSAHLAG